VAELWEALAVCGGLIPNLTVYDVASVELHVSVGDVLTFVAPLAGDGELGVPGGGGGAGSVENDHTGPVTDAAAFLAVACQKYVVL